MQISHTELQRIRLLIWYPEKDTVPEKEMIESRRGQRLAFLRKMIERITGEKEWQQHEKLDSGSMRVHCIEPPLNASKLKTLL